MLFGLYLEGAARAARRGDELYAGERELDREIEIGLEERGGTERRRSGEAHRLAIGGLEDDRSARRADEALEVRHVIEAARSHEIHVFANLDRILEIHRGVMFGRDVRLEITPTHRLQPVAEPDVDIVRECAGEGEGVLVFDLGVDAVLEGRRVVDGVTGVRWVRVRVSAEAAPVHRRESRCAGS